MKYIKLISINAILIVFSIELAANIYFRTISGSSFYNRNLEYREINQPEGGVEHHTHHNTKLSIHPVLGMIRKPGMQVQEFLDQARLERILEDSDKGADWLSLTANNYGYFSRHNYPYLRQEREFVIGIFGGSVAQWLATQSGSEISQLLSPQINKNVVILNFAQGGFKQPQQLLSLNYFLAIGQEFDLVLNLDGFNEVTLSQSNIEDKLHPSLPTSQTLLPIVSILESANGDLENAIATVAYRKIEKRTVELNNSKMNARLASVWLLREIQVRYATQQSQHYLKKMNMLSRNSSLQNGRELSTGYFSLTKWPDQFEENRDLPDTARLWQKSSLLMSELLKKMDITYLHLIQPNQYYSKKSFTQTEFKYAISEDSTYRAQVLDGYPVLLDLSEARSQHEIIDATGIFDHEKKTVYIDTCCHLNQYGNDLLADFVSARIVEVLSNKNSPH